MKNTEDLFYVSVKVYQCISTVIISKSEICLPRNVKKDATFLSLNGFEVVFIVYITSKNHMLANKYKIDPTLISPLNV